MDEEETTDRMLTALATAVTTSQPSKSKQKRLTGELSRIIGPQGLPWLYTQRRIRDLLGADYRNQGGQNGDPDIFPGTSCGSDWRARARLEINISVVVCSALDWFDVD